jgi:hypothetical protein
MHQLVNLTDPTATEGWLVFVYRAPTEPSSSRVAVWRDLKRIGAYYLQQCVCVLPNRPALRADLETVRERLAKLGGSGNLFSSPSLPEGEQAQMIENFRGLAAQHYAEIVEECETKFVKEVEFEHFRRNYSFAEAEEIEQDLDKIRRWFARVQERDWFGAEGRQDVEAWIERCAELLDGFFAAVHSHIASEEGTPESEDGSTRRHIVAVPRAGPSALPVRGRDRRRRTAR